MQPDSKLPSWFFRRKLYWYQEKALYYTTRWRNPALFMRMRLGKTLVAIRWVLDVLPASMTRIFIMAPLSAIEGWEKDLKLEGEEDNIIRLYSNPNAFEVIKERFFTEIDRRLWFLVNPETVRGNELISMMCWEVVIIDEGKIIANPESDIGRIAAENFKRAKHRCLLTGMPTPENLMEIHNQMKFLDGRFMGIPKWYYFRNKYFRKDWTGYKWEVKPGESRVLKEVIHRRCFVMTRKDAKLEEVWLSPKIIKLEMEPEQAKIYKEIEKSFSFSPADGSETLETKWAPVKFLWLWRVTGGFDPTGQELISTVKIDALIDLLTDNELSREKVVVWFKFRTELQAVQEIMRVGGLPAVTIHGGVLAEERKERLERWRKDKYVQALLITAGCAKYGMDASAADAEIYYSNEPSYNLRKQSKERIVNPSKETPLLCIDLCIKDTVDEDLVEKLNEKQIREGIFMRKPINMRKLIERRLKHEGLRP